MIRTWLRTGVLLAERFASRSELKCEGRGQAEKNCSYRRNIQGRSRGKRGGKGGF